MITVRLRRGQDHCGCGQPKKREAQSCLACYNAGKGLHQRRQMALNRQHNKSVSDGIPKRCQCITKGKQPSPWHCSCRRWKRSTDDVCEVCRGNVA